MIFTSKMQKFYIILQVKLVIYWQNAGILYNIASKMWYLLSKCSKFYVILQVKMWYLLAKCSKFYVILQVKWDIYYQNAVNFM